MPMALSTRALASGVIDAWLRVVFCATKAGAKNRETQITPIKSWIFNFMFLPVAPNWFTFFHERLDAFVCIGGLHQFVNVDILLLGQCGIECSTAPEIHRLPGKLERRAGKFFQFR